MNHYYNPVRTIEGIGSLDKLNELLDKQSLKNNNILLISYTDKIENIKAFESLTSDHSYNLKTIVFTHSNPSCEQLFELYKNVKDYDCSMILALGGGSTLDVAKTLCCIKDLKIDDVQQLCNIIINKAFAEHKIPWAGIPSTAGTGSEVTCWATIWDVKNNRKLSCEAIDNYAKFAIIDCNLSKSMPLKLALSSALDALAHAIESYWAKATNTISQALALSAIDIIIANVDDLFLNKQSAHEAMAKGSMLAGLAFSNTKTTAGHSISYPLTMKYNIPHGVAVLMVLPGVFHLNKDAIHNLDKLLTALRVKNIDEFEQRINCLLDKAQIEHKLSSFGVKKEDLSSIAPLCINKDRAGNNPVELNSQNILKILERTF